MITLDKIEVPNLAGVPVPFFPSPETMQNPAVLNAIKKANEEYLHWERLKYQLWIPEDVFPTKAHFWSLLKTIRTFNSIRTPILDEKGKSFTMQVDQYAELLHEIDMEMGGRMMGIENFEKGDQREFIERNIIEESIYSSQLEGASTSRVVAKKMLREGRKPENHSEKMILNNYVTMQKIEDKLYEQDLSLDMFMELHRLITFDTIPVEKQGVLRETFDEKGVELFLEMKGKVTYIAPPKEFVIKELPRLIDFANDQENEKHVFIHPLIKAIILHFWVGFLHPFEDGNGRLARILFYWYMLRHKYWAFSYISLSGKILKSPKQYSRAYVYSEQDDNDLTYFIHYNMNKLKLARKEFQEYINKKINENRIYTQFIRKNYDFNERQIKTLQYLYKKTNQYTTLITYQKIHEVSKNTALTDLKLLVSKGLLTKKKAGRNFFYYITDKVGKLFESVK